SKGHIQETSQSEFLLMPYVGHRALILLARWMIRDEPEADTYPMDGSAVRSASKARGADCQSDTAACVDGAGGRS
ncbi:hypothetical protein, partial [Rhizobium esperanzae]|uniref:hypothetical protein n=1 Tax=Rhizobium esperanzae TaxID=1967781 RepID=UPI001AEE98A9